MFKFQKGPIFNNIVLADEINRATPKTQSALLEAMQEKQVSVGNQIQKLDLPFFVLATQNPIEQEGTYPLPEAQLDRFLLKIKVKYPNEKQELEIVDRFTGNARRATPRKVLNKERVFFLQNKVLEMPIANDLKQKAVNLILLTRNSKNLIEYGASPRASLGLIMSSKARAFRGIVPLSKKCSSAVRDSPRRRISSWPNAKDAVRSSASQERREKVRLPRCSRMCSVRPA